MVSGITLQRHLDKRHFDGNTVRAACWRVLFLSCLSRRSPPDRLFFFLPLDFLRVQFSFDVSFDGVSVVVNSPRRQWPEQIYPSIDLWLGLPTGNSR